MIAAAPILAEAPEVINDVKVLVQEAKSKWHGFWEWFAHNAALTEEENYEGLPAALGLAYVYAYPVVQDMRTIQKQFSGVLDAAHKFLGGAGSALSAGEKALAQAGGIIEREILGGWS